MVDKKITKVKLSKKFVKGIDDDLILPTINWDDFLENNWCYVYPNNGTAENPANVIKNSRYILENPFPGYIVGCIAEVYWDKQWGPTEQYLDKVSSSYYTFGTKAAQINNDIIAVQTGSNAVLGYSQYSITPIDTSKWTSAPSSLPCRIKIYKIGKIKKNK